jgi:peptide/nickel transport system permease protein
MTRIFTALPLVFVVVTLTFVLVRMAPGDPAYILAGDAPTDEFLAHVRQLYGLDLPVWDQYVQFLSNAFTGDFGTSIFFKKPVFEVILDRFPATILLTMCAMAIAATGGILLAATAARRHGTNVDAGISAVSMIGYSIPTFWVGQILILIFAIQLRWLPVGGMVTARRNYTGFDYFWDVAVHLILPATALGIFLMTMIARFTRTALIEALDRDFVTVARAKGASERRILWNHAFRVAVTTTVTILGLEFGTVLVGAVLVETIFGWPGLGRLFYDAISKRDFPLLTGSFIFTAVIVVLVNALTDLVCAVLDPRLRK